MDTSKVVCVVAIALILVAVLYKCPKKSGFKIMDHGVTNAIPEPSINNAGPYNVISGLSPKPFKQGYQAFPPISNDMKQGFQVPIQRDPFQSNAVRGNPSGYADMVSGYERPKPVQDKVAGEYLNSFDMLPAPTMALEGGDNALDHNLKLVGVQLKNRLAQVVDYQNIGSGVGVVPLAGDSMFGYDVTTFNNPTSFLIGTEYDVDNQAQRFINDQYGPFKSPSNLDGSSFRYDTKLYSLVNT